MTTTMMEAEKVCKCPSLEPRDICHVYSLGYITEYKENYDWGHFIKHHRIMKSLKSCPELDRMGRSASMQYDGGNTCGGAGEVYENVSPTYAGNEDQNMVTVRATSEHPKFISSKYKSVFRGSKLAKDSQGRYINPFKQVRTLSNGRRFMYDDTHPDMIYGSQFSPELVDVPNIYSYTSLNHLTPEIPWDKTISWKAESEKGCWPTKLWKQWSKAAFSPTYDGYDNQCRYSVYKVPVDVKKTSAMKFQEEPQHEYNI